MNAVEIEEAISALVEEPFDPAEFPYQFLVAFGNKETTIKRLRKGSTNQSDLDGGLLQRNNIHLKVCEPGEVGMTLAELVASTATSNQKAKYALATDGEIVEAENIIEGETLACKFEKLADHFGFFLSLAGITTVRQIRENAFDIKATSRLNKLYIELLKENSGWDTGERREELNHFFARLIFCFFAEDTNIFSEDLFTDTIQKMTAPDSSNTHEVLAELFKAMDTPPEARQRLGLRTWATTFPYVNGGLFSGATGAPRFSKIARSYLIHIGGLDWTKINPDIFGSMIQAVAEDDERGELGMHYTSVPNILKVLNPLLLDGLRLKLDEAADNKRKLLNLRNRMARIRVFDPACGSGNFLVIAYKEIRAIEAEINRRRGEGDRPTEIPLTNFRGIELRHFASEIARLALIIAEYQCDVLYRGPKLALLEFLPLDTRNWIASGNALHLDWLTLCPPTGSGVKIHSDDLFDTPLDQPEIDFDNEGGETYICGNPPYVGSTWQSPEQKADLKSVFAQRTKSWKSLDYVSAWFMKAADYGAVAPCRSAFVATNSICQGQQVPILWPLIYRTGHEIGFAHTSFKWANLASRNAGVTVVIVGIAATWPGDKKLYSVTENGESAAKTVPNINAYLVPGDDTLVSPQSKAFDGRGRMEWGNKPTDGGYLFLNGDERSSLLADSPGAARFVRRFLGAKEFIQGQLRYCLWIEDRERAEAEQVPEIKRRLRGVARVRAESKAAETRPAAAYPHRFRQIQSVAENYSIVVARVSSEHREYHPVGLESGHVIVGDRNFALYDAPLWNLAVIASRLHWVWIGAVCVRLEMRFSYSNTLGWNAFPLPTLTAQNRSDLSQCAEKILLAREAHFPATIADLYDRDQMPSDLRQAHEHNDETLERIYIGRLFRNDTERLERLFSLYAKATEVSV